MIQFQNAGNIRHADLVTHASYIVLSRMMYFRYSGHVNSSYLCFGGCNGKQRLYL